MGSLPIHGRLLKADEGATLQYSALDYHPKSESPTELYPKPLSLQHQHSYPYLHPFHPQQKGRPVELDRRSLPFHSGDFGISQARKTWASSVDLACIDPEALRFGALEDARRGSTAISTHTIGRHKSPLLASREKDFQYSEFVGLKSRKPYHFSASSVGSGAYDRIKERQRKLQALQQAVDGVYAFLPLQCIETFLYPLKGFDFSPPTKQIGRSNRLQRMCLASVQTKNLTRPDSLSLVQNGQKQLEQTPFSNKQHPC